MLGGEPDRGPPRFEGGSSVAGRAGVRGARAGGVVRRGPCAATRLARRGRPGSAPTHAGGGRRELGARRRRRRAQVGAGAPDLAATQESRVLAPPRDLVPTRRGAWAGPEEAEALVAEVVKCASDLLDGRAADPEREVERGFAAAAEVIERAHQHLDSRQPALHPVITEVMGHVPAGAGTLPTAWLGSGTSAERMGVLFVVAGLLKEIGRPIEPGAEPILVVEDLEAYMHVMTLAAAMRLVARIRWQRILTTESSDLLGEIPLAKVRRLVRHEDLVYECRIDPGSLSPTDLRRVTYHLRERRGQAMFSRCWLLVEGESEAWLLPELARLCGYELVQEGIALVEYAQAGLDPAIRTADGLGIEWHVLADGDEAGRVYRALAESYCGADPSALRVTALEEPDLELFLWHHGYDEVYKQRGRGGDLGRCDAAQAGHPPRDRPGLEADARARGAERDRGARGGGSPGAAAAADRHLRDPGPRGTGAPGRQARCLTVRRATRGIDLRRATGDPLRTEWRRLDRLSGCRGRAVRRRLHPVVRIARRARLDNGAIRDDSVAPRLLRPADRLRQAGHGNVGQGRGRSDARGADGRRTCRDGCGRLGARGDDRGGGGACR